VRALGRVLADAGASFHELAAIVEQHWPPAPGPRSWWQALADDLLQYADDRSIVWGSREISFLRNIRTSGAEPSIGQQKWLLDIEARQRRRAA
jgi:hypothetical protein